MYVGAYLQSGEQRPNRVDKSSDERDTADNMLIVCMLF